MGIYVKFTKTTHQIWSCHSIIRQSPLRTTGPEIACSVCSLFNNKTNKCTPTWLNISRHQTSRDRQFYKPVNKFVFSLFNCPNRKVFGELVQYYCFRHMKSMYFLFGKVIQLFVYTTCDGGLSYRFTRGIKQTFALGEVRT